MINVICVKLGSKFNHTDVNRLFKMCKRNITIPFTFFCYTDNCTYIDSEIKIIDFVDNNIEVLLHNKLFLFSKDFYNLLNNTNKCVYFDLDIIIKHNIDELIMFETKKLAVIKARWKDTHHGKEGFPHFDHNINSSCMIWQPEFNFHLWEKYISQIDYYQTKYLNGMDAYLYYEHGQRGELPREFFYSYLYGGDLQYTAWARKMNIQLYYEVLKDFFNPIPIVLLNGPVKHEVIKFKQYYED